LILWAPGHPAADRFCKGTDGRGFDSGDSGNASEILSLSGEKSASRTKGVDSVHTVDQSAEMAGVLAKELRTTLAITGPIDLITDASGSSRDERT